MPGKDLRMHAALEMDKKNSNNWQNEPWLKKAPAEDEEAARVVANNGKLKQKAEDFADKTSLHGVNFMRKASSKPALAFFVCIFITCFAMTVFQVSGTFRKYFDYPVDTKVTLDYEQLEYPTVTICNLNPFRKSKLYLNENMKLLMQFAESVTERYVTYSDIEESLQKANKTLPEHVLRKLRQDNHTEMEQFLSKFGNFDQDTFVRAFQFLHAQIGETLTWNGTDEGDKHRKIHEDFELRRLFVALVSAISSEIRREMGHQLEESIISCSFNGFECDHRDFEVVLSGEYGNCFQFNSAKRRKRSLLSRQPGPVTGLNLVLYNQHFEYVKAYTRRSGFRVAIHPFNSLPFPQQSGLSVATGVSTDIGIKMVSISRLGGKYGTCEDDDQFLEKFGALYTTTLCHAAHLESNIMANCNCMRLALSSHYPLGTNLTSCSSAPEKLTCVQKQILNSLTNYSECPPACKEIAYEYILSQYAYPELVVWGELVVELCELDNFGPGCLGFLNVQAEPNATRFETYVTENNQLRKLRANFAELRIYYVDLNYEQIEQEPSYDLTHLGGDVGGALGLWFGMSVFTGVELITFFLSLIVACTRVGSNK